MATFTGNGTGSGMYGYMHARVYVTRTDNSNGTTCSVKVECYAVSDGGSSSFISGRVSNNEACTTWSSYSSEKSVSANATVSMTSATFTVNRTTSQKTITCRAQIAGGGTGMYQGTSDTASVSVTIPALASYTVSYNANGGTGAPANQTKYHGQTLTLSSTVPTYSGYSFSGWNTNQDGSGTAYSPGGSYTANAGTTLYAQWTVDYIPPSIGSIDVIRCNSAGNLQEDSTTYIKVTITWTVDSNYTGSSCAFAYKLASDSQYNESPGSISGITGSSGSSSKIISGTFAANQSYRVRVKFTDAHGGFAEAYASVPVIFAPSEFKTISCLAGGTGLAIGKIAVEPNKIESTLPIMIQSIAITDGVTPSVDISTKSLLFLDNNNNEIGWCDNRFEINNQPEFTRLFVKRAITTNNTTNEYFNGIYMGLKNDGSPLVAFNNYTNKHAWQNALKPDILFSGDSMINTIYFTVNGDPNGDRVSAANYNHMRIYYKYFDSRQPESSVEVFEPNGKYVHLFIGYAGYGSGFYWPSGRDVLIEDDHLSTRGSYYTSNATSTVRTIAPGDDTHRIRILRVEAWNDSWWG